MSIALGAKKPISSHVIQFSQAIGVCVRHTFSICYLRWADVRREYIEVVKGDVQRHFVLDFNDQAMIGFVEHQIFTSFKEFIGDCHRHFKKYSDPEQAQLNVGTPVLAYSKGFSATLWGRDIIEKDIEAANFTNGRNEEDGRRNESGTKGTMISCANASAIGRLFRHCFECVGTTISDVALMSAIVTSRDGTLDTVLHFLVFVHFILRLLHSLSSTRRQHLAIGIISSSATRREHSASSISSSANVGTRHHLFVCERRHSASSLRLHSASASSLRLQTRRRHHLRMTSFSVDETSNQSCYSPVLGKRKLVKPPPSVWEHFIKVEGCDPKYPRAACKHCGTSYACDSKRNCTTNLKRHLEKCKMYVNPLEDNVEGDGGSETSLMAASFTQENCRKMLARMVILDELPFKLFTVTVDNASSNDVAIAYLVKKFKGRNGLVLDDDAKTEVTRYLDEARIDCIGDEYLNLLTWWKVNSSRFKIISQVARDIYGIPISTVPSKSAFSTGGRVLDSFRSSLTPQTAEALICAQNWIQSKPLDDMTEEIDGAEEIDEEFINIGKEMKAPFENLNNDSMV
ncbi:putative transposase [Cucumis melo var. makuwa]|uniref:Transposase n=1 Tax=Cucumis melo var. makuwa TaxID=1194695 RepID=A0A5A7SW63_CUCMM|nr:putative transposase [Cucumis melo var. makuwa]